MLKNCIEDVLGYKEPSSGKPFTAYKYISDNWPKENGWIGVQEEWRKLNEEILFEEAFRPWKLRQLFNSIKDHAESK